MLYKAGQTLCSVMSTNSFFIFHIKPTCVLFPLTIRQITGACWWEWLDHHRLSSSRKMKREDNTVFRKKGQQRKREWERTRSGVHFCTSNPASACTEPNFSLIQQKALLLLFLFIMLDDVISHTAHSRFHFLNVVESLDSCIQHKYDCRGFSCVRDLHLFSPWLLTNEEWYGAALWLLKECRATFKKTCWQCYQYPQNAGTCTNTHELTKYKLFAPLRTNEIYSISGVKPTPPTSFVLEMFKAFGSSWLHQAAWLLEEFPNPILHTPLYSSSFQKANSFFCLAISLHSPRALGIFLRWQY